MEKKAMVKYHKDYDGYEGYTIEIYGNGGWYIYDFFPLFRREGASAEAGRDFVSCRIIHTIHELLRQGYQFTRTANR